MFKNAKSPNDRTPYPKDPSSRILTIAERPGTYCYVVDLDEVIHVAPNASHIHPKILGMRARTLYAGELVIGNPGEIDDVDNCSGTFEFHSQNSLCCVKSQLMKLGFNVHQATWHDFKKVSFPSTLECP
jgi:hypothetical protein